jgi:hypothetical protein
MKKRFLYIVIFLCLFSCEDPGGDPLFEGFEISFENNTNKLYDAEIVIGALINNVFKPTDSISIGNIKLGKNNGSYFLDENRWKPKLDKIRNLPSKKCVYRLKLSDGRKEFLRKFSTNEITSILLPETGNFKGYFGLLLITINDNNITGGTSEEL